MPIKEILNPLDIQMYIEDHTGNEPRLLLWNPENVVEIFDTEEIDNEKTKYIIRNKEYEVTINAHFTNYTKYILGLKVPNNWLKMHKLPMKRKVKNNFKTNYFSILE